MESACSAHKWAQAAIDKTSPRATGHPVSTFFAARCKPAKKRANVGGGADPHGLVGRVKETAALEKLGAEHYMDSVLLGDSAYKVTPGFTGQPIIEVATAERGADITGAVITQAGDSGSGESGDRELLARFLLDNL